MNLLTLEVVLFFEPRKPTIAECSVGSVFRGEERVELVLGHPDFLAHDITCNTHLFTKYSPYLFYHDVFNA